MTTNKHIDKICIFIVIISVVVTVLFMNSEVFGVEEASREKGYETLLFDASRVHTINIIIDDWDDFISNCTDEKYRQCSVVIDNDAVKNVAIRAKGNTSLSNVKNYDNDRYSFKIEFDHYDKGRTYYGLDKLSLNNIIQDNTYMKDFLTYQMMHEFGADAPLCSYAQILVNGEEWGLYLAVEGVEDSFLERSYGNDHGNLYKPDNMDMGGGRGHGGDFKMDEWRERQKNENPDAEMPEADKTFEPDKKPEDMPEPPEFGKEGSKELNFAGRDGQKMPDKDMPNKDMSDKNMPPEFNKDGMKNMERGGKKPGDQGEGGGPMGSGGNPDISLIYSDDDFDSYENIFNNAKTDITDADKRRLIASLKALNEYSAQDGDSIEDIVNVEEVIRYFVVHNFVCNFDSYTGGMIHNYYLYEKDGQLSMIPWDYNLAFGGFSAGRGGNASGATEIVNFPIDEPVSGGTVESRPMLSWIFENEEYTELYHEYFNEFVSRYYESGYFTEWIDSVYTMIAPYVEADTTKFCTYDDFEKGVETLKSFCLLRFESIRCQLDGTISATADGQKGDTLIDASDINISDMGSMDRN